MNIGILGPGAIGGLLGCQLEKTKNKVFCFGTKDSNKLISQNGICVMSELYGFKKYFPKTTLEEGELIQYLFLTVKGCYLKQALEEHRTNFNKNTVAISLLNGFGYREIIEKEFKNNFIIGSIGFVEALKDQRRRIVHKSRNKPHIEIASNNKKLIEDLKKIRKIIIKSRINCEIIADENYLIWRKLIRLCTISTITSMSKSTLGRARSSKKFKIIMESLVSELCLIASVMNMDFNKEEIIKTINKLPENLRTSMQNDLEANNSSEIEFILGSPLKLGNSFNLDLPTMTYCYRSLKTPKSNFSS